MANAGLRRAASHAHSSQHISLGHFGTATYNNNLHQWSFLRQPYMPETLPKQRDEGRSTIKLVKQACKIFTADTGSNSLNDGSTKVLSKVFLRNVPEAVVVDAYLGNEFLQDNGLINADDLGTNLLEFGSALVLGSEDQQSGLQTIPIAVNVSPDQPNRLVLRLLDRETVSVNQDGARKVRLPRISQNHPVLWTSRNGSISQLHFSARSSSQAATWLAVRQDTATSIFQPLLHRTNTTSSQKATVDTNLIIEIPISNTGGVQHADVRFHPQDPHLIAIVDAAGTWSTWKISGNRSRSARVLRRARLLTSGTGSPRPSSSAQTDGWHRIIWLSRNGGDIDCLMTANRQSIMLFSLDGMLLDIRDVRMGSKAKAWVLDTVPASEHAMFVLTKKYIFTITVNVEMIKKTNPKGKMGIMTLAVQNHFRGLLDRSLKLHLLHLGTRQLLFLHSAIHQPISVFECIIPNTANNMSPRFWDSAFLEAPASDAPNMESMQVELVSSEWVDQEHINLNIRFLKIYFQDNGKNVHEALYQVGTTGELTPDHATSVPLPHKQHKSVYRILETGFDEDLDDFIVSDHDDVSPEKSVSDTSVFASEDEAEASHGIQRHRLCDLSRIYNVSVTADYASRPEAREEVQDLLAIAKDIINGDLAILDAPQLISELPVDNVHVADIESDSHALDSWLHELSKTENLNNDEHSQKDTFSVIRVISTGSVVNIYDQLVDLWMISLSNDIPARFRVHRERFLRQIALDLYLSTILIRPHIPDNSQTQHIDATADAEWEEGPNLENIATSIETPPPSSIPGTPTQPSSMSDSTTSLLARYINFSHHQPTQTNSTITNDILTHLPTSHTIHPDTYDYSSTELSISLAHNNLLNLSLDPKSKRKADKLARAQKKRLDKQAQIKKVAFESANILSEVVSSQLPFREVQSSQGVLVGMSQSQSQSQSQGGPGGVGVSMTQPERGIYGRREKKGKGARQKGF